MKKAALVVTTALAFTLTAARLHAEKTGASGADRLGSAAGRTAPTSTDRATNALGTSNPSGDRASDTSVDAWRHRWHNSRWWYWMPEEKWVVWTGTTWVPFGESGEDTEVHAVATVSRHVTSNGSREGEDSTALAQPTYRSRGSRGGSGAIRGSDYALYGWSWGPGTAYRDGPPRRF